MAQINTAVIIAAGRGSRLDNDSGTPKPLRKVLGVALIERIIMCAARAGMTRVVVVVGFEKDKIITFLKNKKWPVTVETVENTEWEKSNGVSVLSAQKVVNEDFALLMSDHIFDPNSLKALCHAGLEGSLLRLAVDYRLSEIFDMPDATKVEVQNGRISQIGKDLVQFNAVDTGMFIISQEFFKVLAEEQAARNGDCSLSHGVGRLAREGRALTFDVSRGYWQDVDDAAGLKQAEKVLLKACRKDTDGFVSRNFNRYVSLFISNILVRTPLTANQITFFVTLIGIASGIFAAGNSYSHMALGAVLFKLTSILDGVDGEVAKLKYTASKMGAWLDTIGDNLTYITFFLGLSWGTYVRGIIPGWFALLPVSGIVLIMLVMFTHLVRNTESGSLLAIQDQIQNKKGQSFFARIIAKLQLIMKRDSFALVFLILALCDLPQVILLLITLFAHGGWIVVLRAMLKM